jgi:hypothetical protein
MLTPSDQSIRDDQRDSSRLDAEMLEMIEKEINEKIKECKVQGDFISVEESDYQIPELKDSVETTISQADALSLNSDSAANCVSESVCSGNKIPKRKKKVINFSD